MKTIRLVLSIAAGILLALTGCSMDTAANAKPRTVLFIGVDVSGSFQKGPHAQDSLDFLARYIHAHLNGLGGLEKPQSLFVGAIGGVKPGEPKTFQPIQTFEGKSVEEIRATLADMFPSGKYENNTDFNAFVAQMGSILRERNLALKPVAVVMLTDGEADLMGRRGGRDYTKIDLSPLEQFSRNVTLRLLYTNAESSAAWRNLVPRRRVKIWTQDADVMARWKDPNIFNPQAKPEGQVVLYRWIQENVDYGVRLRRVG
jgi:hypothetical protein